MRRPSCKTIGSCCSSPWVCCCNFLRVCTCFVQRSTCWLRALPRVRALLILECLFFILKKIQNRLAHIVEVSGAGDVLYTSSQVSSMSCMPRNHCKCTCCSVCSLGLFFLFVSYLDPHFICFWEGIQAQLRWNPRRCKAFRISSTQLGKKLISGAGVTKRVPVRCRRNRCMLSTWLQHKYSTLSFFSSITCILTAGCV